MQFSGCYSYRDITLEELKRYDGSNDIRINTNQEESILNRKFSGIGSMSWETGDSSIIIKTEEINRENNYIPVNKNSEIKYQQIESIEIEQFDIIKTGLLTVGIISVIALFIAASTLDFDMSGGTLSGW